MTSRSRRRELHRLLPTAVLVPAVVLLVSCAPAAIAQPAPGASPSQIAALSGSAPRLSLQAAIRQGRDLGPIAAQAPMHLEIGLAPRDAAGLDALIARGVQVGPGEYASRFAPSPAAVDSVRRSLAGAGLTLAWTTGDQLASVDGSAAAVQRFFAADVHQYVAPGGERFFAPRTAAAVPVPASLQGAVTSVIGFDDWSLRRTRATPTAHGVTPLEMMGFYDIASLRTAGIDGSGLTVVLPEIDSFAQSDLDAYAAKFNLPAFSVEVHRSTRWGSPEGIQNEANMDLEIVHAIAPAAKLVVYYSSPKNSDAQRMLQALFSEQGGAHTIVSSSIGTCEASQLRPVAIQEDAITRAAAARGTSIFVASGDRGAYDCLPFGDPNTLAIDLDGGLTTVTSVGGTTAYLDAGGGWGRETSWGEPVEQWGGNGGLSIFWQRPSWQAGPGVDNRYSNGMRQTPDVSANANGQSGWEVISGGSVHRIGGTSAAAPLWAAITALLDQVLTRSGHQTLGFANPALYWMAQHASSLPSLPSPPYHDITQGTNLYYPATQGWDFATGLGSPDAAALATDVVKYMESLGR
ncbi:MAG TPA: S53 family serine peptidase [Candidatus Dormibacteraeota bacterium]|nr:S53 family serine peptidase [Candidatus Dormibacteraeota bacterium]